MKTLNIIALALLIIGGLNWGMIGLFGYDVVAALFGFSTVLANIVYTLIGISAVYSLYLFRPVWKGSDVLHYEHGIKA